MKLTIDAGIREKPIATTNTIKTPLPVAALYLSLRVIGKLYVTIVSLKF